MHSIIFRRKRCGVDAAEQAKMERLETAEAELRSLQARAEQAIKTLDARQKRNHWRESIEQMIQGVS